MFQQFAEHSYKTRKQEFKRENEKGGCKNVWNERKKKKITKLKNLKKKITSQKKNTN